MNQMYLPTKDKFFSEGGVVSLSLAAFFKSEKTQQEFRDICRHMSFGRVTTGIGDVESVPPEYGLDGAFDVLLVELDVNARQEVTRLQGLLENDFASMPVIVTARNVSLNAARELMHMGVVDILPQPFSEGDILTVMRRAGEKRGPQKGQKATGKVISFLRGGGGVGATTLAVQSGCFLAKKLGCHQMAVGLLDLDIQFGTAGLYLDMQNGDGLMAILAAKDRMDGTLLQGVFDTHVSTGLKVLTIPRDVVPMDVISDDTMVRTLKILRQDYKFTLIDMPGTWTAWSTGVLKHSDMIILVTEISIAAISQARRQLDTLQAQGLGDIPVKVVLNRVCDKMEKMFSIKEVEAVLGRTIDHKIPNDYQQVCEAGNQGVPLMKIARKSKVDQSIQAMISDVAGDLTDDEIRGFLTELPQSFLARIGLSNVFSKK